jgi:hypothetical protein
VSCVAVRVKSQGVCKRRAVLAPVLMSLRAGAAGPPPRLASRPVQSTAGSIFQLGSRLRRDPLRRPSQCDLKLGKVGAVDPSCEKIDREHR